MAMWRAIVSDPFQWKGKTLRERDIIAPLTDAEMRRLDSAHLIGAITRIPDAIETATISAPETTARTYRRGGR